MINSWKADQSLLAEAVGKVFSESYTGAIDGGMSSDENIPAQYQDTEADTETDFANFVDSLTDEQLEQLRDLSRDDFDELMFAVKDEYGYRFASRD